MTTERKWSDYPPFPYLCPDLPPPQGPPPKGWIPEGAAPERKALLLADMLIYEPDEETVLVGETSGYTLAFAGYMGNFTSYDMEALTALCALAVMHGTHARQVEAALEARPLAVHAVADWAYRTPLFEPEGQASSSSSRRRAPDDPQYRTAPQSHDLYAKAWAAGLLPVLMAIIRNPGPVRHLLAAPGLPGLLTRLEELSSRPETGVDMWDMVRWLAGKLLTELRAAAAAGAGDGAGGGSGSGRAVKSCGWCGAVGTLGAQLKRCAACRRVHYCSEACQRGAWKEHRKECAARTATQG